MVVTDLLEDATVEGEADAMAVEIGTMAEALGTMAMEAMVAMWFSGKLRQPRELWWKLYSQVTGTSCDEHGWQANL